MRRLLTVVSLALLAPLAGQAAPYSKIVMCDLGGIPLNRTTTPDLSLFANFTASGSTAVVAPGCDFGGIPLNSVTTTDASLFATALGSNTWPIPASGFVNFTLPVPGSCQAGSPCDLVGTLANVSRESVNSPGSGFDNQRGQLTVSVAYTNNTAGCTGPASITPTGTLNNLAGANAVADLAASLNCPAAGSVDVTLYVPAGIESLGTTVGAGTAEVCPGPALCAPGAHLDSITITVPIADVGGCEGGTANGVIEGVEDCDDNNMVNGDCCNDQCQYESNGSACGDPDATGCNAADTCDGAGACVDNVQSNGTECRADAGACDVAETCDGVSATCPADGFEADGFVCGAAAGECDLDDTCLAGACNDNGFAAAATACGDPSDTSCDNPDTCDGAGACLANNETAGFVCGAAAGECDLDDTCDGAGACSDNGFVAAATPCTDDGFQCTSDACDGAGACAHPAVADATPCTDCAGTAPTCDGCLAGVCQDAADAVVKLELFSSGGGNASVDVVINTALPEVSTNGDNLGGYDIEVTFDDTQADFSCPSGLVQPGAPFNEPLLNQCVIANPGTASATIRIADANTTRSATAGAVTVKRLNFTNVAGPQTLSVALTGGDADNLINYDALTVDCGGACSTQGVSIP